MSRPQGSVWSQNPDCIHYNIKTHSPEWYAFRSTGFGASEIGAVCGASDWAILPQIIEQKCGLREDNVFNESMLAGLLAESGILERWRYYDNNGKNYVQNYKDKLVKREYVKFSGYMTNKKYPNLFCSTDGWARKGSVNLITSESMPIGFPIEAKIISGFHTDKWVAGVPPQYIFQGNQEMMIFGVDYCEFSILKNGTDFEVIPMELSQKVVEIILEKSDEAWALKLKVDALKQEMDYAPYNKKAEIQAHIDSLMPLPDDNPIYKKFYSEKMNKIKEMEKMPDHILHWAKTRCKIEEAIKELNKESESYDNNIRREFTQRGTEFLDAGTDGKLRYYIRSNGKSHTLDYAGFKAKPKGEDLETIIEHTRNLINKL